jgi:probable rRNA maturation factor
MLQIVGKTYLISHKLLESVANTTFRYLGNSNIEIEFKFVTIPEIIRLNKIYRGRSEPTDVLSFVIEEKPLLGQIFICYNFTKHQAEKYNKTFTDEVALLLVHGILHISGFDHLSPDDETNMQKIETEILERENIKR